MIFQLVFLALTGLSLYALSLLSIKVIKRISLGFLIPGVLLVGFVIVQSIFFDSMAARQASPVFFLPGLLFLVLSLIIFLIAFIKEKSKK